MGCSAGFDQGFDPLCEPGTGALEDLADVGGLHTELRRDFRGIEIRAIAKTDDLALARVELAERLQQRRPLPREVEAVAELGVRARDVRQLARSRELGAPC
jgi:hypothetical protein